MIDMDEVRDDLIRLIIILGLLAVTPFLMALGVIAFPIIIYFWVGRFIGESLLR